MNMYRRRSVFEFRDHLTRHEMIEVETLLRRVGRDRCSSEEEHTERYQYIQQCLERIDRRRATLQNFPEHFIIMRHPHIRGESLEDYMHGLRVVCDAREHTRLPYTDYSCRPQHVREFYDRLHRQALHVMIVPNVRKDVGRMTTGEMFAHYEFSFVLDWVTPIEWTIDLGNYTVSCGPDAGKNLYNVFYKANIIRCVRRAQYADYREIGDRISGPRLVRPMYLARLVEPFAEYNKHRRE